MRVFLGFFLGRFYSRFRWGFFHVFLQRFFNVFQRFFRVLFQCLPPSPNVFFRFWFIFFQWCLMRFHMSLLCALIRSCGAHTSEFCHPMQPRQIPMVSLLAHPSSRHWIEMFPYKLNPGPWWWQFDSISVSAQGWDIGRFVIEISPLNKWSE